MAKVIYLIAPQGFQDQEYKDSRDVIEAAGHEVDVASLTTDICTGKFGMQVTPDMPVSEINERLYDAVVVIGGPGTSQLSQNPAVLAVVAQFHKLNKIVAAICMAPVLVLTRAGILIDKKVAAFDPGDGSSKELITKARARFADEPVVVDGNLITANGPDAAKTFGEAIVHVLG